MDETTFHNNVWGRVKYLRRHEDKFRLKSEAEVLCYVLCEELQSIVNKLPKEYYIKVTDQIDDIVSKTLKEERRKEDKL